MRIASKGVNLYLNIVKEKFKGEGKEILFHYTKRCYWIFNKLFTTTSFFGTILPPGVRDTKFHKKSSVVPITFLPFEIAQKCFQVWIQHAPFTLNMHFCEDQIKNEWSGVDFNAIHIVRFHD